MNAPAHPRNHASIVQAHRAAVLDAEVRRIARQLSWCGPLQRDALARLCGASHWHEGSFDEAVRRGIAAGRLRRLPFDYIAVARAPEPTGVTTASDAVSPPEGSDG